MKKTDKHRAYKAEQRAKIFTERARQLNPFFSPEFSRELKRYGADEEDVRRQLTNKSRYKVTVSGHIVEVWEYEEGVRHGPRDMPDKEGSEQIKTEDGLTIDPETGEVIYDPLEARRANMRASKNEFRRLILANFDNGSKFITLTFRDGAVNDVKDVPECNKAFDKFIKRMRRKYGDFKYARVIEFQDGERSPEKKPGRGAVHYHLIFDGLPYIPYDRLGEIWGNGYIGINRIEHVDNVGAYVRKYMAQDMEDTRLMGKKAYATSHNLVRPQNIYGSEAVELIEAYQLAQKKEVYQNSYESEHQGRTHYKEYNLKANEVYRRRKNE